MPTHPRGPRGEHPRACLPGRSFGGIRSRSVRERTALEGLKEFADGWFARRHKGMQVALEAAQHIGAADTPSDIVREYQNWLTREMELLAEDGRAYQQQVLRAGVHLSAQPEAPQTGKRRTG